MRNSRDVGEAGREKKRQDHRRISSSERRYHRHQVGRSNVRLRPYPDGSRRYAAKSCRRLADGGELNADSQNEACMTESGAAHAKSDRVLRENGDPCRIRTCDHMLRRQVLYPAELRGHEPCRALRGGQHMPETAAKLNGRRSISAWFQCVQGWMRLKRKLSE